MVEECAVTDANCHFLIKQGTGRVKVRAIGLPPGIWIEEDGSIRGKYVGSNPVFDDEREERRRQASPLNDWLRHNERRQG